jgi:peptidoglycan-associated lipoprotein
MSQRRINRLVLVVPAAAALVLSSCSRPKPVVAPEISPIIEEQTVAAPEPAAEQTVEVEKEPGTATAERPESGVGSSELPQDLTQLNQARYLKDVFFETNKSDLLPETRDALAADAAWLRAHPGVRVTLEGHCDERNTEEYNLALGWRRANAAKAYLVSLGVAAQRLDTVSYGEEKPFASCHQEECWMQNRRVHFVITAR